MDKVQFVDTPVMNVFRLLTLEFNRSTGVHYSNYQNRNQRENIKMKLSLPMLFLLSKALKDPNPQVPPVCGEYEELAECSNRCFESNCNDYWKGNKICPDCKCLTSLLKLLLFLRLLWNVYLHRRLQPVWWNRGMHSNLYVPIWKRRPLSICWILFSRKSTFRVAVHDLLLAHFQSLKLKPNNHSELTSDNQ